MSDTSGDPFQHEFRNTNPCRRQFWMMVVGLLLSALALTTLLLMREQWFGGNDLLFYAAIASLMIITGAGTFGIGAYYLCLIAHNKKR